MSGKCVTCGKAIDARWRACSIQCALAEMVPCEYCGEEISYPRMADHRLYRCEKRPPLFEVIYSYPAESEESNA